MLIAKNSAVAVGTRVKLQHQQKVSGVVLVVEAAWNPRSKGTYPKKPAS